MDPHTKRVLDLVLGPNYKKPKMPVESNLHTGEFSKLYTEKDHPMPEIIIPKFTIKIPDYDFTKIKTFGGNVLIFCAAVIGLGIYCIGIIIKTGYDAITKPSSPTILSYGNRPIAWNSSWKNSQILKKRR